MSGADGVHDLAEARRHIALCPLGRLLACIHIGGEPFTGLLERRASGLPHLRERAVGTRALGGAHGSHRGRVRSDRACMLREGGVPFGGRLQARCTLLVELHRQSAQPSACGREVLHERLVEGGAALRLRVDLARGVVQLVVQALCLALGVRKAL